MNLTRGSIRLLLILPTVAGGLLLALAMTLRGKDLMEGRRGSRMSPAEERAGTARCEQRPRRVSFMPMDPSSDSRKTPVPKGTFPADVLIVHGDPPPGELAGLWLDLNTILEEKESTPAQMHQERVIRWTLQFLDLTEPAASAFRTAVSAAVAQLESAQEDLHRSLDLLPPDLQDEDRESMERAILEVYDARKRSAVTGVLTALGQNGRHPGFRNHLEMWLGYLIPL